MKKDFLVVLLAMAALSTVHAAEKDLRFRFELMRKMDGTFSAGQRGRLVVSGDVFGQSRHFPNDIRIMADDGTQWPFFLHVPKEGVESKTLEPEILNRSWVAGSEPCLQFDLVMAPVDGTIPVHNRMELDTSGRDYVRRVEVFTGTPDQPSGRLASGYLIDFSRQRNAQNRTIRYPDSDAGRLHVRIYPNAQAGNETFDLSSATLRYRAVVEVGREPVVFVELDVPEREQEAGAATRIVDLGEAERPVEFITFEVENESFARCVSVYGRNADHEPWRWVGGGEIHRLNGDRETTVTLHAKDRYLKVQVFHYDDPPLAIHAIVLEAIPRYLVFEATSNGSAALFFRDWDIKAPRYDLKGRIDNGEIDRLPVVRTLDAVPNEAVKAQPWRKYSKILGGLAVGAVSLLVIWVIASMLKQQKTGME